MFMAVAFPTGWGGYFMASRCRQHMQVFRGIIRMLCISKKTDGILLTTFNESRGAIHNFMCIVLSDIWRNATLAKHPTVLINC